jgi:hypothetical protein
MRITATAPDADPPKSCDAEDLLQRVASGPDLLSAARSQMLLALVRLLRADGPHPKVWGYLLGRQLHLWLHNPANSVSVEVWPDWRDYGPARNGLPVMHYRIQVKRRGATLTQDARAGSAAEADRVIREAFGWLR